MSVTWRFLEQLKDWVEAPPTIEQLDVIGSYNLFGAEGAYPGRENVVSVTV